MNIQDELRVLGCYETIDGSKGRPRYNTPITPRENFKRFFISGAKPMWSPGNVDFISINTRLIADNIARATVTDNKPFYPATDAGGRDLFGVEWKYIPTVGGSMVVPGNPMLPDIEKWRDVVKAADLDTMDWESEAEKLRPLYTSGRINQSTIYTGLFERLISLMDFEDAIVALIDDDQKPYVHEIFDHLCTVYEKMMRYLKKYFDLDMIVFHDDWGSQRAPFFSLEVCREMLVPYLKRLVGAAHSNGMIFNFHSCGKNEMLVPAMIEAGVDMWAGQNLNDWELLSQEYDGKLKFSIAGDKFNIELMTEDEYINMVVSNWTHLTQYKNCMVLPTRMYYPGLSDRCYERIYTLSRRSYSE